MSESVRFTYTKPALEIGLLTNFYVNSNIRHPPIITVQSENALLRTIHVSQFN